MQWRICFFYIQRAQHVHIDLSCIQQRNVTADDENASLALKFLRALRQWRIRKKYVARVFMILFFPYSHNRPGMGKCDKIDSFVRCTVVCFLVVMTITN